MAHSANKEPDQLTEHLGQEFMNKIAASKIEDPDGQSETKEYTNSQDISCECKTIILKPNIGKLILPTESMIKYESKLNFLQYNDGTFKNLKRGCYWLVDDMYKFEHIGFSKKLDSTNHPSQKQINSAEVSATNHDVKTRTQEEVIPISHLRYLVCADCNLGPLGWHDSNLNESYLYVW